MYRAVQIHFRDVAAASSVYRVIRSTMGIEGLGIELAPQDETAAYDAALAAALRDAQSQAEAEAKRTRRHVGRALLVRASRVPEPSLSQTDGRDSDAGTHPCARRCRVRSLEYVKTRLLNMTSTLSTCAGPRYSEIAQNRKRRLRVTDGVPRSGFGSRSTHAKISRSICSTSASFLRHAASTRALFFDESRDSYGSGSRRMSSLATASSGSTLPSARHKISAPSIAASVAIAIGRARTFARDARFLKLLREQFGPRL